MLMNLLAMLAVVGMALGIGIAGGAGRLVWRGAATRAFDIWLTLLTGLGGLTAWMLLLAGLGLPWQTTTLIVPAGLVATSGLVALGLRARRRRRHPSSVRQPSQAPTFRWRDAVRRCRPAWGEAVAATSILLLTALLTTSACWTMADVVFHWGFKAHQWWLGQGIDFAALNLPWNVQRHADYPILVPALFVATALARGAFAEISMGLWSAVFVTGVAVATREALHQAGTTRWVRQATLAIVITTMVRMTIAYRLAGSPDMLLAAVITTGVAVLLAEPNGHRDLMVGLIAAVAVATKVEGAAFAGLLLVGYGARRLRQRPRDGALNVRSLARLLAPSLVVGAPWWLLVAQHGLLTEDRGGHFAWSRLGEIAPALFASLTNPVWHGLGLVLLLLPIALGAGATRLATAVVSLQLLLYVWIYLDTPFDPVTLVQTTGVRLMVHVWPAVVVLVAVALDCRLRGPASRQPTPTAGTMAS